jgi:hypothetical protein
MRTPIEVISGPWEGHLIRRARKSGSCEYWKGANAGGRAPIKVGDLYMEGEHHPGKAGGFAAERWCMNCAGNDAKRRILP